MHLVHENPTIKLFDLKAPVRAQTQGLGARMRSYNLPAIITGLLISNVATSAQTFTAKVVGVHDGDTMTVYDGREQTRIRRDGVDCPEMMPSKDFSFFISAYQ